MLFARLRRFLFSMLFVMLAVWPLGAAAQNSDGIVDAQRQTIESLSKQTDEFEKRIAANSDEDAKLVEIRLHLEDLARQLLASATAFRPRLAAINERLQEIGPPPPAGQSEPEIITG